MMPERRAHNSADFDVCDIDINYDWINESQLQYTEMEEAESFIQQAINDNDVNQVTIVLTPTGVAAFKIQGSTIHLVFSILITGTTYKLVGGPEASKADSETAKGLESKLLLARNTHVMLTANL
ncbi:hypothetical protein C1646_770099 [Rhizophagus diaphanus]|nr:hypothetical protein C1646_770099 [Rhizophagus diaphanus] [Rhizophagus sp. MUCL 43196]